MKIVTIHQPEHLSYLGFFHKVSMADTLVLLDNVRYEKNYFQNRNKVNTSAGVRYVTVPVTNTHTDISEVLIADNYEFVCKKNAKTIEQAYSKCPYWSKYGNSFLDIYTDYDVHLSLYNERLLKFILNALAIDVDLIKASSLNVSGAKTELLASILTNVGADKYISGCSGRDYLKLEKMPVPVEFQQFAHPIYTQWGKTDFQPCMSVIDALFNVGSDIMNIIKSCNNGKGR